MTRLIRFGVAATLAAISVAAFSQGAPPNPDKTAIEARQAVFKLIQSQNGPLNSAARGSGALDTALVTRSAERIKVLAGMIPELFTRDTKLFKEVPTRALDGIWASQADFKVKADALVAAADAVATAAKGGDRAAVQTAVQNMGRTCGSCHDAYRAK